MRTEAEVARDAPEVVERNRITGDDCYLMRAHLRDVEHLEEVIDRFTPFGQTTTSIVQSSPVPLRPIALDETNQPFDSDRVDVDGGRWDGSAFHGQRPVGGGGAPR
jgi:hypothetical protein